MNCFKYECNKLKRFHYLHEAVGLPKGAIVTAVGAGGKTTIIKKLACENRTLNRKVLVTTTTHMMIEKNFCSLSGDINEVKQYLNTGICFLGKKSGIKMSMPDRKLLYDAMEMADSVIIEGDGSKRLPLKFPNEHEPVILPKTTDVIIVMGLSSLGKTVDKTVHRTELVCDRLGISPKTYIDTDIIYGIISKGYKIKDKRIHVVLNQADNDFLINEALKIGDKLKSINVVVTSFSEEERNDL